MNGSVLINSRTSGSVLLGSDSGNIELQRDDGAYIDFKRGTEDYNVRIDNFGDNILSLTGGNFEVSQDSYINVGNAYVSSGTFESPLAHLATNAWHNGSTESWNFTGGEGCLYQQLGQNHVWYTHDGSTFTIRMGLAPNGNLSVTGDIIAFASDERLKTNISPITDALFKVNSLNGFTYKFNEIGEKLGFNPDITYAGVSAQEVQKVLPEVVHPAPVDDKYITVQYDKVVPLLIEAIKELSDKVEKLEQRLEDK